MTDKQKQAQASLDEINGPQGHYGAVFRAHREIIIEALEAMASNTTPELECFYTAEKLPKKFVALYSDGSGCDVFYETCKGKYNTATNDYDVYGVDSEYFQDAGYCWFMQLPDNFELWGEDG